MTKEFVDIRSPFTGGRVMEVCGEEEKVFRGEKYVVNVRYYQCEDTGEQFTTSEQDSVWTGEIHHQYRARHCIPSPEEIKALRTGYGLNYSQFSRLLGFGPNQLKNYEEGQVPSESNGKMLSLVADPLTMMRLLEISRNEFSEAEYQRIKQKIAIKHLDEAMGR